MDGRQRQEGYVIRDGRAPRGQAIKEGPAEQGHVSQRRCPLAAAMIIPNSVPPVRQAPSLRVPPPSAHTVFFPMLPGSCVPMRETVPAGVQVKGLYEVGEGPRVDLKVTNPLGAVLYAASDIKVGSFGFTTEQYGEYEATFLSVLPPGPLPAGDTQKITFTVEVKYESDSNMDTNDVYD